MNLTAAHFRALSDEEVEVEALKVHEEECRDKVKPSNDHYSLSKTTILPFAILHVHCHYYHEYGKHRHQQSIDSEYDFYEGLCIESTLINIFITPAEKAQVVNTNAKVEEG